MILILGEYSNKNYTTKFGRKHSYEERTEGIQFFLFVEFRNFLML